MRGYGQFCPVAKAAQVFCERWTALIIRDLGSGVARFSELHRGVPLMSRSMLSRRLQELECEGIIERRPNEAGRGWTYHLTTAGRELLPAVKALGIWGQRWSRRDLAEGEVDVSQLLWSMERFVRAEAFGDRRTVVQFEFKEQPANRRRWWFVNEAGEAQLCVKDPGFEVDLYLTTRVRDMIRIWRGDISLAGALESGLLEVFGPPSLRRALPRWLALHPLAGVRPACEDVQQFRSHRLDTDATRDTDRAISALAARLSGPVLLPGQPEYEPARQIWNAMIDRYPAAIARCGGAADVKDCVDFARDNGMAVSVRGGGHNIAGTAICDDGLVIDLSGSRSIHVDARRRRVRVAPGVTLGELDREAQAFGLVVPAGIVSSTGVAGLTLAGGFGWLTRRWGFTSDNLISVDLVTAGGDLVRASRDENADLFWAIRGGGGNFGVVTSFEFGAHPLGPLVVAGMVVHPMARACQAIDLYREVCAAAPDELTSLLMLRKAPPAPFLPAAVHGQSVAVVAACHGGSPAVATKLMRPLKKFGQPLADTIEPKLFCEHQRLFDAAQPKGRRYYWKSDYFDELSAEVTDLLLFAAERLTSPHSAILVMHLGGAAARIPDNESAASHRHARYVVNIAASWEHPPDEPHVAWARQSFSAIAPYSLGGGYINFLTADELAAGDERVRASYGSYKYERLSRLKATWDPTNLFRHNQNISPATSEEIPRSRGREAEPQRREIRVRDR
jgi:FAD/FMN-containing dehydrogenase/DNA-binding HxlR family transcriptional regulator